MISFYSQSSHAYPLTQTLYTSQKQPLPQPHQKPIRRILKTAFCPLPTIKNIKEKSNVSRLVYDAAHYLFRDYSLNKMLLIYQFQRDKLCYDVYITRTNDGWKDSVTTRSIESNTKDKKTIYMIDGLREAMKEEKEIQPLLPHMAQQLDIMCRLLNI